MTSNIKYCNGPKCMGNCSGYSLPQGPWKHKANTKAGQSERKDWLKRHGR